MVKGGATTMKASKRNLGKIANTNHQSVLDWGNSGLIAKVGGYIKSYDRLSFNLLRVLGWLREDHGLTGMQTAKTLRMIRRNREALTEPDHLYILAWSFADGAKGGIQAFRAPPSEEHSYSRGILQQFDADGPASLLDFADVEKNTLDLFASDESITLDLFNAFDLAPLWEPLRMAA
jgi:hypothetical protein